MTCERLKSLMPQNVPAMRLGDAYAWAMARPARAESGVSWGFVSVATAGISALVGVAAVLHAQNIGGMERYVYRELAGSSLGMALAFFLAGATESLPLRRIARIAGWVGLALCMVAVAGFVWLYPTHWNVAGRDHSPWVVVTYTFGLSYLVGAITSGLLTAYLELRERHVAGANALEDDVTDEEVVRDILETTARSKLTWGGVRSDERELEISSLALPTVPLKGNLARIGILATIPGESFREDVGALLAFRGVRDDASEEYDDSDVNALTRLRQQRAAQQPRTFWQRLAVWWNGTT